MDNNKISIEEFLNIAGVKEKTIIKNKDKIPGLTYVDGKFDIIKGTRYPCDLHRYKMRNSEEKRYVLLKTISEYKYICAQDLRVYEEQFEAFLEEFLAADLIQKNHLGNDFGANGYDCTGKGDEVIMQRKSIAIRKILEFITVAIEAGKLVKK